PSLVSLPPYPLYPLLHPRTPSGRVRLCSDGPQPRQCNALQSARAPRPTHRCDPPPASLPRSLVVLHLCVGASMGSIELPITHVATLATSTVAKRQVAYFTGSRRVARSVPTIVVPVNPPASTALR